MPPHWAGLKFFNVFGPNEYHKGAMMSVVAKRFDDIKTAKPVQLFKSHRDGIADGDQRRDFIYVEDVVRVILWLLASGNVNGIFNVGTGKARSFRDLIVAAYGALGASARTSNMSICPCRFAIAINISRRRPSIGCKPPATMAASLRLKTPSASMSEIFSINRIAIGDRCNQNRSRHVRF